MVNALVVNVLHVMLAWHEVRLQNTSSRSSIFSWRFTGEIETVESSTAL
jgi:hypothetical protein